MATVGEAVAALGIEERGGWEAIIVRPKEGRWQHYPLATVAAKPLDGDLYAATGLFYPDRVGMWEGRRGENVAQIVALPLDVDLKDWIPAPLDEVLGYPDDVIESMLPAFRADVEETLAAIGLPWHRCLYTGHGLAYTVNVPPHLAEKVSAIREWHGRIVDRINSVSRLPLVDPAVRDAGTRLLRLPGSVNTKSPRYPRTVRVLEERPGAIDEATLIAAAGGAGMRPTPPPRIVPKAGEAFNLATERMIVDHVAPHWSKGERHRLALAISGLFAKANVPEEQTTRIVEALSAGDEEARDRLRAVHTTYERVRSGLAARGFHELALSLPSPLVAWLDEQAQAVRAATTPRVVFRPQDPKRDEPPPPEFRDAPSSALHGWIGEYVNLVGPTTEAPKSFHIGASLTLIGALLGRHVSVRYGSDPLYGNLYTVLVGKSNKTKKDTAIKRVTHALTESLSTNTTVINHGIHIVTDVGSSTALIHDLEKKQNVLLYMTEFSRLMGNARRKGSETITPTLIEAFDTPYVMHNRSMANPIEARFPYLSMLAATQPDILSGLMSSEDMLSGFANRIFFVCGMPTGPIPLAPEVDRAVLSKMLMELWRKKQSYPEGSRLELADDARARWCDWYIADWHAESASPEEEALRQRHAVLIQKIALIYSVCDGAKTISLDHLNRAIDIIDWMWINLRELAASWGRSVDGQIEVKVLATIDRHGPMKRWQLQAKCSNRRWTSKEFGSMVDWMIKNGTLVTDPSGLVARPVDA